MRNATLPSLLPYTDARGITVTRVGGSVHINGHPYSPVDALDVAAHIGHAVALIGAERAATASPCAHPHHTNPKEATNG